jgi:membrane-associated phospholipid phosphatase
VNRFLDEFVFHKNYMITKPNRRILYIILLGFIVLLPKDSFAEDDVNDTALIPITTVFYGMDRHMAGSFTYNYGLHYIVGIGATYGLVESGADWRWYKNAKDHPWIPNTGRISVAAGPIVSAAVPLGLYLYGRSERDIDLQITGLALGQAAIDAAVITSVLKAFTGRPGPQHHLGSNDYSDDFRFGFLRGGIYQGWPSSHTAAAFAMATTLIGLYPDNTAIKIGGLAYAAFIGIGVSTNIHWLSDVVTGGLIGYAIGTIVGDDYRNLLSHTRQEKPYGLYITPAGITFTYSF